MRHKIRTAIMMALAMGMLLVLACVGKQPVIVGQDGNMDDVFARAELLRKDIRMFVTDAAISPYISQDTKDRLAGAETLFLKAKDVHEKGGVADAKSIADLADSADEIIAAIDQIALGGKYEQEIIVARLALKFLRNRIQLE